MLTEDDRLQIRMLSGGPLGGMRTFCTGVIQLFHSLFGKTILSVLLRAIGGSKSEKEKVNWEAIARKEDLNQNRAVVHKDVTITTKFQTRVMVV